MERLIETTKLQERGTVTIPQAVRDRLGLKKGGTVAFVEGEDGRIEIRTLEADTLKAVDEIGAMLKERGLTMDQWLKTGRQNRKKLFEKLYRDSP